MAERHGTGELPVFGVDVSVVRNRAPARRRIPAALLWLRARVRLWRTRSRERSDLFRAPPSVVGELSARGLDVRREAAKPFWQR